MPLEHINVKAQDYIAHGMPVISVDANKREPVGDFESMGASGNRGRLAPIGTQDLPDSKARGDLECVVVKRN